MGHLNAALEWLVQAFNDMWPMVLATFIGAWLAFQYLKHYERKKAMGERRSTAQYINFVLTSQSARMKSLREKYLEPLREHARRGLLIEPVVIHDEFPRVNMAQLPTIFEKSNIDLMNDVIEAEYGFVEVTRLLRRRDKALRVLDEITESGEEANQKRAAIRKHINNLTDRVFELTDKLHAAYDDLFKRMEAFLDDQPSNEGVDLVDYLAWIILSGACATVAVFFFSHWAVNAGTSTNLGLDISLVSALVFALSLYASLALCLVIGIMSLYALIKGLKSFTIYFWSFLVTLQPALFLFWLDVS